MDAAVVETDHYFLRAMDAGLRSATAHYVYACFLLCCGRKDRAEDFFLRALEEDPTLTVATLDYGMYLCKEGNCRCARLLEDNVCQLIR